MAAAAGSSSNALAPPAMPTRSVGHVRRTSKLDGATPEQRPAQALRRAITLDFGDVHTNGEAALGAQESCKDARPAGASIPKSHEHQGSKPNVGASMILITKTHNKKIICAAWYTTPEVLGMDIVDQLKTKHENDGKEGSFSKRLSGFTWIGYDPSGITKGEKAIRKAARICTPVSAPSTSQVMSNVQQLGKGLLTSNFPMDMHIAELLISDDAAKKLNAKPSLLQRTIKLDTSVETNPFGNDSQTA